MEKLPAARVKRSMQVKPTQKKPMQKMAYMIRMLSFGEKRRWSHMSLARTAEVPIRMGITAITAAGTFSLSHAVVR